MRKSTSQRSRRNREKRSDAEPQQVSPTALTSTGAKDSQERTGKIKQLSEIAKLVQSLLTIAGIIAAAIWFIAQSESSLKANITHSITHRKIHDDWTWIHAAIEISNVGKRRLALRHGEVKLYLILPLDISIHDKINHNIPLVDKTSMIIQWPTIENITVNINNNIYPGETDKIYYEFSIPSFIETVELYTFFSEISNDQQGWSKATIYDIKKEED